MKVITLNDETFLKTCSKLISKLNVNPDMIVGIHNGGGHVVEGIKNEKYFNPDIFEYVKVQRSIGIKNKPVVRQLLKHLPYFILDIIRIAESYMVRQSIKNLNKENVTNCKIDLKLKNTKAVKTILIVDDAIDTGKTMFTVKSNLLRIFPDAEIKIAVISWTIENSIEKPDFYLYKGELVRFPWSKDYKRKNISIEAKSFSS